MRRRPTGRPQPPLFFNDVRAPFFVAGRMPAGITEVTVVLSDVVELPDRTEPAAVLGHSPDGSSARLTR
ncbi:MAG: hypothetical protein M3203_15635 [Actinomycetota bacterium]|nr:hypothetical protein [Actinomycetota bacterium]